MAKVDSGGVLSKYQNEYAKILAKREEVQK